MRDGPKGSAALGAESPEGHGIGGYAFGANAVPWRWSLTVKGRGELKSGPKHVRVGGHANRHGRLRSASAWNGEERVWLEEILNLPARAGLISWRV